MALEEKNLFCPNCGGKLSANAKFCTNCGYNVEEIVSKMTAPKIEEVQPEEVSEILNAESINEFAESNEQKPEESGAVEDVEFKKEPEEAEEPEVTEAPKAEEVQPQTETFEETEEEPEPTIIYTKKVEKAENAEKPEKVEKAPKAKKTVGIGGTILISAIAMVLGIFITIIALLYVPVLNSSFLGQFIGNYRTETSEKSEEVEIDGKNTVGDTEVDKNSNVTITIEGDSDINAAAVYAKCEQSVVGIRVLQETSSTPWSQSTTSTISEGSGVVYAENGYIVTNHHVIEDALDDSGDIASGYTIRVFLDKSLTKYYDAEVVGSDSTTDLALLKINVTGLTPIELESSDDAAIGDKVYAIGSPGGLEFMNSISEGIISGINRNLYTDSGYSYDLIQTTAAINPGNSGGALLNREGKLVGICELKIVSDGYEGMGFAISSNTVKTICDSLMENGKIVRPQLGISVYTAYTAETAAENGTPVGAWVYSVTEGGAADKAGIETNMVITKVNGVEISDYVTLRAQLLKYNVGDTITLTVYKFSNDKNNDGEELEIKVTLESDQG